MGATIETNAATGIMGGVNMGSHNVEMGEANVTMGDANFSVGGVNVNFGGADAKMKTSTSTANIKGSSSAMTSGMKASNSTSVIKGTKAQGQTVTSTASRMSMGVSSMTKNMTSKDVMRKTSGSGSKELTDVKFGAQKVTTSITSFTGKD
jgi:hypothetical protein